MRVPTELTVGRDLPTLRIRLIGSSEQQFGLTWTSGGVAADLTGQNVVIALTGGTEWAAVVVGGTTTWTLTKAQSTLSTLVGDSMHGHLVLRDTADADEVVAFRVLVEVQR